MCISVVLAAWDGEGHWTAVAFFEEQGAAVKVAD